MADMVAINYLEPEGELWRDINRGAFARSLGKFKGLSLSFHGAYAVIAGPRPLMDQWVAAQNGSMEPERHEAYERACSAVDARREPDILRRVFGGAGASWVEKVPRSQDSVVVTPCRWQGPKKQPQPPQTLDAFQSLSDVKLRNGDIPGEIRL